MRRPLLKEIKYSKRAGGFFGHLCVDGAHLAIFQFNECEYDEKTDTTDFWIDYRIVVSLGGNLFDDFETFRKQQDEAPEQGAGSSHLSVVGGRA